MAKITLPPLPAGYAAIDALNDRFDLIEAAIEDSLSRSGKLPNSMEADLDLNGYRIINIGHSGFDLEDWIESLVNSSSIATDAAAAATDAAAAATDAAAAATDAAAAATDTAAAALGHLEEFQSRYYGPLVSDPTLDPNGNLPTTGDFYFRTTDNVWRVYRDDGTWETPSELVGVGTAAVRDAQTDSNDATEGRLMQVGAFGIGKYNPAPTPFFSSAEPGIYSGDNGDFVSDGGGAPFPNSLNTDKVSIMHFKDAAVDGRNACQMAFNIQRSPTGSPLLAVRRRYRPNPFTNSSAWGDWAEIYHSDNLFYKEALVTLGGDYTGVDNLRVVRIGSNVTISSTHPVTHSSLFTANSDVGVLPEWAIPDSFEAENVYGIQGTTLFKAIVSTQGSISTHYVNFSGTPVSTTSTGTAFHVSYNV